MKTIRIPDVFEKEYEEIKEHVLKNKVLGNRKDVPEDIQVLAALLSSYRGLWNVPYKKK